MGVAFLCCSGLPEPQIRRLSNDSRFLILSKPRKIKNMKSLIVFVSILVLSSCNLFVPSPNEEFYCKINGKKFRPSKSSSSSTLSSDNFQVSWDENEGGLSIRARNNPNGIYIILVFEDKNIKIGRYALSKELTKSKAYYTPNRNSSSPTDCISKDGFIEITKKDGYLLSGKFEFNAEHPNSGVIYNITNGEFNKISYYL